ncbi:hypothetical protein CVT24_008068 [Panaeolus cyanescens]|uniref:Lysine-specific metallo-endopeptidase domain-containing protein n=1 Tax=Panaeolus cyanescens TaxID=181874 RepID=A0A409YQL6_9AGAR|nr:hypothetical protein CVT24_008068 [Panaeolus cyanescens]
MRGLGAGILCVLVSLFVNITYVITSPIPLPLDADFGNDAPTGNLQHIVATSFTEARTQITEMKDVVHAARKGDKDALWKIHNIFETKVDLAEMEKTVEFLDGLVMEIIAYNVDLGGTVLASASRAGVRLAKRWFDKSGSETYMRALTLFHEGTHMMPGSRNGNEGPVCGYMHEDYWKAVTYLGSDAWRNADAWGVFGYYVLYGHLPSELPRNPDWPRNFNPNFSPRRPTNPPVSSAMGQHPSSSFGGHSPSEPAWVADWRRKGKLPPLESSHSSPVYTDHQPPAGGFSGYLPQSPTSEPAWVSEWKKTGRLPANAPSGSSGHQASPPEHYTNTNPPSTSQANEPAWVAEWRRKGKLPPSHSSHTSSTAHQQSQPQSHHSTSSGSSRFTGYLPPQTHKPEPAWVGELRRTGRLPDDAPPGQPTRDYSLYYVYLPHSAHYASPMTQNQPPSEIHTPNVTKPMLRYPQARAGSLRAFPLLVHLHLDIHLKSTPLAPSRPLNTAHTPTSTLETTEFVGEKRNESVLHSGEFNYPYSVPHTDVLATPIPLRPELGHDEPSGYLKQLIDISFQEARAQITEMKSVVAAAVNGDPVAIVKVWSVFDENVDFSQMEYVVDFLDKLVMEIIEYNVDLGTGILAIANRRGVRLSTLWFSRTGELSYERALTLIHEGTHMMPGSKAADDFFQWSSDDGLYLVPNGNKGLVCGYMHRDYWKAVRYLREQSWRNADSWGAFGYYVVHGHLPPELPRSPYWPPDFEPDFIPRTTYQQFPYSAPSSCPFNSYEIQQPGHPLHAETASITANVQHAIPPNHLLPQHHGVLSNHQSGGPPKPWPHSKRSGITPVVSGHASLHPHSSSQSHSSACSSSRFGYIPIKSHRSEPHWIAEVRRTGKISSDAPPRTYVYYEERSHASHSPTKDSSNVLAIPIPLHPDFGDNEPTGHIKDILYGAFREATAQITEMKVVVRSAKQGDKDALWKIHNIFERKVDLEEMEEVVDFLDDFTMGVIDYNTGIKAGDHTVLASGRGSEGIRLWSPWFRKMGSQSYKKPLALIHEATHMRKGSQSTDDYFSWSTSGKYLVANDNTGPVCGYMHEQYWEVVTHLQDEAWRNAESWGVFGYYVVWGRLPPDLQRNPDWPPNFNPNFTPHTPGPAQHSSSAGRHHDGPSGPQPAWVADYIRQGKIPAHLASQSPAPQHASSHSAQEPSEPAWVEDYRRKGLISSGHPSSHSSSHGSSSSQYGYIPPPSHKPEPAWVDELRRTGRLPDNAPPGTFVYYDDRPPPQDSRVGKSFCSDGHALWSIYNVSRKSYP